MIRLPISPRTNLLPRRTPPLKIPERLRQLQRLNHNALLLLIIPNLRISSQREIFAQRMSIKAIIRHNAPQIGVSYKEDPKKIIHLPLIPVCSIVEMADGRDRCGFVCVGFDADARVVADGEEVVDDFEAVVARRVVDGCYVADLREFGGGVIF